MQRVCRIPECGVVLTAENQIPAHRPGRYSQRICRKCWKRINIEKNRKKPCRWEGCAKRRCSTHSLCPMHLARHRGQSSLPMDAPPYMRNDCPEPYASRSDGYRWSQYRVTPSMWLQIALGGCWICGSHARLCVDHEHGIASKEGKPRDPSLIRGCLCEWHNGWVEANVHHPWAVRYFAMKRPFG